MPKIDDQTAPQETTLTMTRSQLALHAAREAAARISPGQRTRLPACTSNGDIAADRAFELLDELERYKAVSYVVEFHSEYRYSHSLDIAVRLVESVHWGGLTNGQLLRDLDTDSASPAAIEAARTLVAECIATLHASGDPFAIIVHFHGDQEPIFQCGGQADNEAIQSLRYALADSLMYGW